MIEAVTAILVCEEEVFVIKRQPHLRAFPGYHAFPGGKIDAEDDVQLINHSDLAAYPHLPKTSVKTTSAADYAVLLPGAAA